MTERRDQFTARVTQLQHEHEALLQRNNSPLLPGNGIFTRWQNAVLTRDHTPLEWRYDFSRERNPYFMERMGINATFNPGAMKIGNRYILLVRVEGTDRKSFFAVAESDSPVEGFRFRRYPIRMPQTEVPDTNVYDMRLTMHEDGYLYGLFCTERKDLERPHDPAAAIAQCGIARTHDLDTWQRLPDLVTSSGQQRNVVLHPRWIDGNYAFYTRPQDGFISVGSGGGIGWGLSERIDGATVLTEKIIDDRAYHTIKELKNGQGPCPIMTAEGWLHLAHGVRNTAAGLRYVLYIFVTELDRPWIVRYAPGGHLISPHGVERTGDVSNVVFSNGWIADPDGSVYIYYASSDTRVHVATSSIERLLDYARHTPPDGLTSSACVEQRVALIDANGKNDT